MCICSRIGSLKVVRLTLKAYLMLVLVLIGCFSEIESSIFAKVFSSTQLFPSHFFSLACNATLAVYRK